MLGRLAGTVAVANVAAAAATAALRGAGPFGDSAAGTTAGTGPGDVLLLGVLNLVWVLPGFVAAGALAHAAARRARAYPGVLGAALLATVPFVGLGPLLVLAGPDAATYLALLYAGGFVAIRRLVARSVERPS